MNLSWIKPLLVHVYQPENLHAFLSRGINSIDLGEEEVDAASSRQSGAAMSRVTGAEEDEEEDRRPLPSGWEAHEDEDGAYYWHIKSGTIQRDFPEDLVSCW